MRRVKLLAVVQDEHQAEAKHVDDVGGQRQQEEEEVAVVPAADAVVHPGAVVVKVLPGGTHWGRNAWRKDGETLRGYRNL